MEHFFSVKDYYLNYKFYLCKIDPKRLKHDEAFTHDRLPFFSVGMHGTYGASRNQV